MEEQQELTREELQRQLAERERQDMEAIIKQLQHIATGVGFEIIAIPQLTPDGRLIAQWGVRRAQG